MKCSRLRAKLAVVLIRDPRHRYAQIGNSDTFLAFSARPALGTCPAHANSHVLITVQQAKLSSITYYQAYRDSDRKMHVIGSLLPVKDCLSSVIATPLCWWYCDFVQRSVHGRRIAAEASASHRGAAVAAGLSVWVV